MKPTSERLAARAAGGCQPSFEQLLARFEPVVHGLASEFYAPGLDRDDLVQAARIGFAKAVRLYKPARGVPFRPYAAMSIRRELGTAVKAATRGKHTPVNDALSLDAPVAGGDRPDRDGHELLAGGEDPAAVIERRETLARMLRALVMDCTPLERQIAEHRLQGRRFAEHPAGFKSVDNAMLRVRRKLAAAI